MSEKTLGLKEIDLIKIKKLTEKGKFYAFFEDYMGFSNIKKEITEIISKKRSLEYEKAVRVRIIKILELKIFIEKNSFEDLFMKE